MLSNLELGKATEHPTSSFSVLFYPSVKCALKRAEAYRGTSGAEAKYIWIRPSGWDQGVSKVTKKKIANVN